MTDHNTQLKQSGDRAMLAAALAAMAALLICVVVYAQRQALVYPDPSEGVACSLAFDSLAEQIGSPHRTCIPKETTK